MNLHRVEIKNFRSISEQTIYFSPKCRVLVGINESGKTNLLKALSMLSAQANPTKEDLRETHPGEGDIDSAYVRFIFRLEPNKIAEVYKNISEKVLAINPTASLVKEGDHSYSLEEFCRLRNEALYIVDILSLKKHISHWALGSKYKVVSQWKKLGPSCPASFTIDVDSPSPAPLSKFKLINPTGFSNIPSEYLVPVTPEDIDTLVNEEVLKIVKSSLPECVYWTYADANLLPPQIGLDQFAAAPDSCPPLKYMFELAGYSEITKTIQDAKAKNAHGIRNLLDRVSKSATEHIRGVWKEYKDIEILLEPNGALIDASIKDTFNRYALTKRSDGFKRFISFLLHISTKVRTGQLENTLILIDEPDVGLHPSGARYLKDELIKISESNFVAYSTHSIFMIDRENIGRHIIVTKKKEITTTEDANGSSVFDEEVIFNALKFSMFETLKEKNIVFEGWKDKQLFLTALKKTPPAYKTLKESFKDIGLAQLYGVKDAGRVATMLELAARKYLIVSDNDKPALEAKKRFEEHHGQGAWLCYGDLMVDAPEVTGEDFIKNEVIHGRLSEIIADYPYTVGDAIAELKNGGKLHSIEVWLSKSGFTAEHKKEVIGLLKDQLTENLEPSQIESRYYEMLNELSKVVQTNE